MLTLANGAFFNWDLVSSERREQLRLIVKEAYDVLSQAHVRMQEDYRKTRRILFHFLTAAVGAEETIRNKVQQFVLPQLDEEARRTCNTLIDAGCTLIAHAAAQAKAIIQRQADSPIIDVFTLHEDGTTDDELSMPLFPLVPYEQIDQFFKTIDALTLWEKELDAFLNKHGL